MLIKYVNENHNHFIKMNIKSKQLRFLGLKGEDGGDDELPTRHGRLTLREKHTK
jgi:hypothetical protein